jgi:hypothetical protein
MGKTGMLGLGFNPNRHMQEKATRKQKGLADLVHKKDKPSSVG